MWNYWLDSGQYWDQILENHILWTQTIQQTESGREGEYGSI